MEDCIDYKNQKTYLIRFNFNSNDFNEYKKTNDPAALSARIDTISTENANLKKSIAESAAKSSLLHSPWSSFKFKPDAIDSQNTQIVCDLNNAVAEEQSDRRVARVTC